METHLAAPLLYVISIYLVMQKVNAEIAFSA